MNVLSIEARNFRRYPELALDLPAGCVAIVGPNGAGKSSLLEAVDVTLYGARSLSDYMTRGENAMHVCVTFDHRGDVYRVRRSWKNGKTTLDLERLDLEGYVPLSRENVKATQAAIEQLLGLTRDTLRASSLLMQGDGAAFTSAQPGRRKEILFDALGLDLWARLLERVRDELRQADRELAGVSATVERLEQDVARRPALEDEIRGRTAQQNSNAAALKSAEGELELVTNRYQAARELQARVDAAAIAVRAAGDDRDRLVELDERADAAQRDIGVARDELIGLPQPAQTERLEARVAELETAVLAHERARMDHETGRQRAVAIEAQQQALLRRASETDALADTVRAKSDALAAAEDPTCQTCGQSLPDDAKKRAIASYEDELRGHLDTAARDREDAASITVPDMPPAPEGEAPTGELQTVRAQLRATTEAAAQRARLEERITGLQRNVDARPAAEQLQAVRVVLDVRQAELDAFEPVDLATIQADGVSARARVDNARATVDQTREQLASLRTRLEQVDQSQADLDAERARTRDLHERVDQLKLADRAYGPNGIPALILENAAIPQIETEANRIIGELGRSYRFELRTQRELKSGDGLREALDIVVHTDDGESPYEAFSGGEKTRINLALRIALARLVATRRGAEVSLLAIDEPDGLDVEGFAQLADVLQGLVQRGEFERVLVVSHHPELKHAFDSVIEVAGGGDTGRPSRVVEQFEAVAA